MALLTDALLLVRHPFVRRAGLKDPNNKTIWWSIHWTTDDDRFRPSSVPMVRLEILFKVPGALTKLLSSVVAATNRYSVHPEQPFCMCALLFRRNLLSGDGVLGKNRRLQSQVVFENKSLAFQFRRSPANVQRIHATQRNVHMLLSVCRLPPPNEQIERVANRNPCRLC